MATVPTAAQLNLGHNVKTTKDTTPVSGPNVELAGAASRIAASQQKMVTEAALQISSDFSAAQDKIDLRTDNINRTREFNTYFEGMSKEFQTLMDGDVADPARLEAFSLKLQTSTENTLNDHGGSAASRNKLAIRLEDQRAKFSAQSKSSVDTAQQAIVDKTFSENIAKTVSKVATGEIDLATALIEVDGFGTEYAEVASDLETFNQVEAAQQMVILGSIQRLVDLGESEKAEALINSNPEVMQTLEPAAIQKMIRNIELQKMQKAKLIEEKRLNQDNILKASGKTDPKDLSPALRMLYYTGKMGTNPEVKDNRTKEMKNAEALAKLELAHGRNSPQYKNLSLLVHKQEKAKINKTDIEKKFDRLAVLNAGGKGDSQEARVLMNQINEQDPVFVENKKKEEEFPVAQMKLIELEDETNMMMESIDEALKLATGEDNIETALKEAIKGESAWAATGNPGLLMSIISGTSDAASLEAVLSPVAANIVLRTMSDMRSQSSSGATGLGAMNNAEREMLRDAEGSLDPRKPLIMIKTLLKMRKNLPGLLKRQQDKFTKGFASVLGIEPEVPDANKTNIPDTSRGQENGQTSKPGVINLLTYGDGENEPPPAAVTPKPSTAVTPKPSTAVTPATTVTSKPTPTVTPKPSTTVTRGNNIVPTIPAAIVKSKKEKATTSKTGKPPRLDYSPHIAKAEESMQYLKENEDPEKPWNAGRVNLLNLIMLQLQSSADGPNQKDFDKHFKSFREELALVFQGK